MPSRRRKLVIQAVEYMVSGGAYFVVGTILLDYFYYRLHWSLWWATIISNLVGWTVNYLLQRYWVFKNPRLKNKLAQTSVRYIIITLVDFVMNYFILYWLRKIGITPAIGQFISAGFFTIWNYFWYKFWVFPERLPSQGHPARKQVRPNHLQ